LFLSRVNTSGVVSTSVEENDRTVGGVLDVFNETEGKKEKKKKRVRESKQLAGRKRKKKA
jgi:hypothetical protein